ncbi:MAG: PAS domain-containing protein, partial [Alphaproteobacteria bacterium]
MKALNAADRLPALTVGRTAVVALPRRSAAPPASTLSMAVVAAPRRSAIVSPPLPLLEKPVPPEALGELSGVVVGSADVNCDRDETSSCAGLSTSSLPEGISLMERSVDLLIKKLGISLPEIPLEEHEVAQQKAICSTYKTAIAACLGILDSASDAVGIIDLQTGLLIYCNAPMQSIFGRLRKDLMFRLIFDFLNFKEEQRATFLEGIRTILHHGQSQQRAIGARGIFKHSSNVMGLFYDGLTSRPNCLEYTVSMLKLADFLGIPVPEHHLGTIFFRHYKPEYQLGLDARVAESVFAHCPLAIVRADFYGVIQDLNHAALVMFNLAKERTIGQNVTIFMPQALRASHHHFLAAFREKIKVKPSYNSPIVNNDRAFGERILTTDTWDGRTLSITLGVRVIDETLVAYIRDRNTLVLGEEYRQAQIKNSFPPKLVRKYFSSAIPDSKEGLRVSITEKAVMSIDLVDSTAKFSECSAEEHFRIMNFFLSELDKIISTYQGVTIKHTGDGLLAIFDPIYKEKDFAKFAVLCASSCLVKAKELSQKPPMPPRPGEGDFFSSRIGVSTSN